MNKNIENGHEYVDLGLPSGTKWATCNIGASSPSDYGDYFAWGGTTTKTEYTYESCKTWKKNLGDISGNPQYDVVRTQWGGRWRLPSKTECEELKDKCTWTWTTQGGHKGYKATGPNGKSIFFAQAGWLSGTSLCKEREYGLYWSSTPDESDTRFAYHLHFNNLDHSRPIDVFQGIRSYGFLVRPVCNNTSTKQKHKSIMARKINKENCVLRKRDELIDQFGNKIVLSGQYAFEWSITNYSHDGEITRTVFKCRRDARKEFNKIKKKQ